MIYVRKNSYHKKNRDIIFPANGPPKRFELKSNGQIGTSAMNFLAGHGGPARQIPKQHKAFLDADNAGEKNIKKFGKPEKS